MLKRRRPYKLEDIFAVSTPSMQTFRALRAKLSRDYLVFFHSLEKTHQVGEAKAASSLVLSTIRLVDRSIRSGVPIKEDVENIIANIDVLNARRDFFIQASKEAQPIREKLEAIEEETGISSEALNITKEVVQRGVKVEKRERREARRREGGARRAMPRTAALAAGMGKGLAVAALGPLYPVAKALGAPIQDILGLGRAAFRRVGERKERRLGRLLEPMAMGYPARGLERGAALRGTGLPVSRVRGVSERRAVTLPFRQFFDKEAYRAKWTKELLKAVKERGKARGKGIGGLPGRFLGGAGAAVAGAGAVVVGAAAAAAGVLPIWLMEKAYAKWTKTLARQYEALGGQIDSLIMWTKYANEQRDKFIKDMKKTMGVVTPIMERIKARERGELQVPLAELQRDPFATQDVAARKRLQRESTEIIQEAEERGVSGLSVEKQKKLAELAGIPVVGGITPEIIEQLRSLVNTMKDISSRMEKGIQPSIKEPGLGDPFDSADSLLRERASGSLTLGER